MVLKYLNASYSVFSYAARRYAAVRVIPPPPPAISVELSSRCNLACPECVTGTGLIRRTSGFISYDLAASVAACFRSRALSSWLSFQGEPMMHPEFFRILELFRGMHPVISTNGHFLDKENCAMLAASPLEKIIISYDGVTPESYVIYRIGGDHLLVTGGVRLLAETIRQRGSKLQIILQFLVHRGNEHEIPAAAAFARSVGARFRVKSMQVLDPARAGDWMPADNRLARYACGEAGALKPPIDDGTGYASGENRDRSLPRRGMADHAVGEGSIRKPAGPPSRGCRRMWTSAVITTDGDVVPCCYDKNGLHVMGNIAEQSFREIWRGERYRAFRDCVMKDRKQIEICSNCPEGLRLFF